MKLTILGSGTSQGVPVIGCRCEVCTSTDSRRQAVAHLGDDRDRRRSALRDRCRPDFRCQMLRAGVSRLDAILLTHEHKDHTGGIDDVRAFNFVDYPPVIHPVDIYAAPAAARVVRKDYDYAFEEEKYRGAPDIRLHEIDVARPLEIAGERIVPVSGHHSERFEVTGYRIGRMAYLTDFKTIADAEVGKLIGVELLVVNALRFRPHPSHFNVGEALALIARVAPRRALITHVSHEIGRHAATTALLPRGVELAYDGLEIII